MSEPIVAAVKNNRGRRRYCASEGRGRHILAASKIALDIDAIAAHFTGKGAWKKRLPSILEMLVVVGR
ncbi:MAG: hypothetical protein R3E61_09305 [Pseudomonadales bacterium]